MFGLSIFTLFVLNRAWKRDSLQIILFVYICSTLNIVELKTRFEKWISLNDVNGVILFHLSYSIILMVYLRSQQTPDVQIKYFTFYWSTFTLFVLNRVWKRDFLQIMIFVCLLDMGHIWTKNPFWDVNNRKWRTWYKIVSPFLYNKSYGLPMLTMDTKCPKVLFYVWLVDLHNICAKQGLETWLTPNNGICICLPDMVHRWT
jgi:hypothetical protein